MEDKKGTQPVKCALNYLTGCQAEALAEPE